MKLNLPHFLFINGPSGSGKSTLAQLICDSHPEAFRESFAEPIREMIWSVFFPEHMLEKPFDLRSQTIKTTPLTKLAKLNTEEYSAPVSVREAMISFSEDYMKSLFGPAIFGRLLWNRCCEQSQFYQNFIIDDSGFEDEAKHVISRVGGSSCHLIRLHRRGCDYSGDSRGYISLSGVQTLDLHNNSTPEEMLSHLHLELGNL